MGMGVAIEVEDGTMRWDRLPIDLVFRTSVLPAVLLYTKSDPAPISKDNTSRQRNLGAHDVETVLLHFLV